MFVRCVDVCKNTLYTYSYACTHMNMCVCTLLLLLSRSVMSDCDPMDCSLPGSSVHGILQEECWSGSHALLQGGLPDPGIKLGSPALQADSLPLNHEGSPCTCIYMSKYTCVHIYYIHTHIHIYIWMETQKRHLAKFPGNRIWINKNKSHVVFTYRTLAGNVVMQSMGNR